MNSPLPVPAEPATRPSPLTRRSLLTGAGALGIGALLTACGSDDKDGKKAKPGSAGSGEDGAKSGPWSFKDDRGRTARTDQLPRKIVAFVSAAAALHDYGVDCVGIFGPSEPIGGKPNPQAGDLDLTKLTSLGQAWGEFNIEKYATLEPDLLISNMFPPPDLWFVPAESVKKIEALAPSVGITGGRVTLLQPLERYTELAKSLGADLSAQKAVDARARFDKAEKTLREAAAKKKADGGLKVLAMTGDAEQMYVGVPDSYCDLNYFKDLGVEFVEGKKSDEFGFWEFLSWENADKYHADLIMVDNRSNALPVSELSKRPTWSRLPAVKADQITPWSMEERYSYAGYAPVLEQLAAAITKSERLAR